MIKQFIGKEIDIFLEDHFLASHCHRVANYAVRIAEVLRLKEEQQSIIYYAGLLHDIGKIQVDKQILEKPSALTVQERRIVEKHPEWGKVILGNICCLELVVPLVYYHHERYDGTGYPHNLKKNEIPLGSKILSVADAFDAMTSSRTYRKTLSTNEALEELKRCSGKQFDPFIVRAFDVALHSINKTEKIFLNDALPDNKWLNNYFAILIGNGLTY